MQDADFTDGDFVSNKVQVDLNVLCALMRDRIGRHVDGTHVVTVYEGGASQKRVQLQEQLTEPGGLDNTISNYQYSASALEREIVLWRLEDQEIRLSPRKTA